MYYVGVIYICKTLPTKSTQSIFQFESLQLQFEIDVQNSVQVEYHIVPGIGTYYSARLNKANHPASFHGTLRSFIETVSISCLANSQPFPSLSMPTTHRVSIGKYRKDDRVGQSFFLSSLYHAIRSAESRKPIPKKYSIIQRTVITHSRRGRHAQNESERSRTCQTIKHSFH